MAGVSHQAAQDLSVGSIDARANAIREIASGDRHVLHLAPADVDVDDLIVREHLGIITGRRFHGLFVGGGRCGYA